jgi:hypothetical protein
MSDNQPTAETVLFSRHRAAELRRIDRDDLIQAADKALEASSHREFHILAPPRTANAVVKAILLLSDSRTKLGFGTIVVGDVGDEFAKLADDSRSRGTSLGAYSAFCAMTLLKLALERDLISDETVDAVEVH